MGLTEEHKQIITIIVEKVLAEQARAAGLRQLCRCSEGVCGLHPGSSTCSMRQPAGDVVEWMCEADYKARGLDPARMPDKDTPYFRGMAVALAIAREGYVSLEDVEKAIRYEMPSEFTDLGIDTFVATIRNRLAKPEEQTDVEKVEAILNAKNFVFDLKSKAAAEIVAVLRAGHHD